jgi:hypothetical protein
LFAGNNTAQALRLARAGGEKPDAIHRVIDRLLAAKGAGYFPNSEQQLIADLTELGYTSPGSNTYIIERLSFFLKEILPDAAGFSAGKFFTVLDLKNQSANQLDSAIGGYLKRGGISTATTEDAAKGFLPDSGDAALIEVIGGGSQAKLVPLTGSGALAELADTLQKSRKYSGAVSNEVLLVTNQARFALKQKGKSPRSGGGFLYTYTVQFQ